MKALTPLEELDTVLFRLQQYPQTMLLGNLRDIINDMDGIRFEIVKIRKILQKFCKDGFAEEGNVDQFTITYDGLISHGYERQSLIDDKNETRIIRNETLLVRGTWAASLAAAFLLLWQVWIWFYPVHKDYPYWIWEKTSVSKNK